MFSHLDIDRDNSVSTLTEMRDLIFSKILNNSVVEEVLDHKRLMSII